VKQFSGRDALLRVRDDKPNTDAEHRFLPDHAFATNGILSPLSFPEGAFA
jgi:hypothetical protein